MRNVLVAVLGITPQILTEAIYYYDRIAQPAVGFSEIQVFTTTLGRRLAYEKLLGRNGDGAYFALLKHLKIRSTAIDFNEDHVHVLKGADGRELDDVRTREDSLSIADQLCAAIQQLQQNPDNTIFATMAGGRKTMGLYMAMAMQLLARPGDRLFHVLPDPRIEAAPNIEFFFPSKPIKVGGQLLKPEQIRIECDEVPLIYWPRQERQTPTVKFSELQQQRQRELSLLYSPPSVRLDLRRRTLLVGDAPARLTKLEFFYYCFFAQRTKLLGAQRAALSLAEIGESWENLRHSYPARSDRPVLPPGGTGEGAAIADLERLFYQVLPPSEGREVGFAQRMDTDFRKDERETVVPLSSMLSRLSGKLCRLLGAGLGKEYSIRHSGTRGDGKYGIWLSPERITIESAISTPPSIPSSRGGNARSRQ
jgi:CRISPR-associated protein (TIGR02584 family)